MNAVSRIATFAFGWATALFLVACTTVHPTPDRAPQLALSPAPVAAWSGLVEYQDEDYLVPLNAGPVALEWRLQALRAATSSIDLQTFIWKDDAAGQALVREIFAAAERGVRVRVLLDDSFLAHADPALRALGAHPNINYRVYNPVGNRSGGALRREVDNLNDFSRINHRMHNKVLVVDGRVAIVGGRNQADEYFGYQPVQNFRDLEIILTGPFVTDISGVFDLYWNDPWSITLEELAAPEQALEAPALAAWLDGKELYRGELLKATPQQWQQLFAGSDTGQLALIVDAPPQQDPDAAAEAPIQVEHELIGYIDASQRDLLLVSAYFIPTKALTQAIQRATARGVRVRILTNSLGSNNHVSAHAAYTRHRPAMLRAGAELYELRADADARPLYVAEAAAESLLGLHAKGIMFDECCLFVGSANLDPRSMRLNTEVGVYIDSPVLNARVRELLAVDLLPQNAWRVELDAQGELVWLGPHGEKRHVPPASFYLRAESWFFGLFPIEGQM